MSVNYDGPVMAQKIIRLQSQLVEATGKAERYREALASIRLMVDAQARDEGLWSIPFDKLQPIAEAYLQQELRRLHECVEHYTAALSPLLKQGEGREKGDE